LYPKCAKTLLLSSAISKIVPGVIPRTPVVKGRGKGWEGRGGEGRRGEGQGKGEVRGKEREGREGEGRRGAGKKKEKEGGTGPGPQDSWQIAAPAYTCFSIDQQVVRIHPPV
jgi:uncharacterized low-complexity protein